MSLSHTQQVVFSLSFPRRPITALILACASLPMQGFRIQYLALLLLHAALRLARSRWFQRDCPKLDTDLKFSGKILNKCTYQMTK